MIRQTSRRNCNNSFGSRIASPYGRRSRDKLANLLQKALTSFDVCWGSPRRAAPRERDLMLVSDSIADGHGHFPLSLYPEDRGTEYKVLPASPNQRHSKRTKLCPLIVDSFTVTRVLTLMYYLRTCLIRLYQFYFYFNGIFLASISRIFFKLNFFHFQF